MKRYKLLSLLLCVVLVVSCLSVLNFSVFADQVSDGFIYQVESNEASLVGIESTVSGNVVIPDTLGGYPVTAINGAFKNKYDITSVTMPDTVTVITKNSFYNCSLNSITLSSGLIRIDEAAFSACLNLQSVVIPDSVKTLGPYVFSWCSSLTSVVISSGLGFIDNEVFNGCTSLQDITLPDSINYIAYSAFSGTKYYNTESNWENGLLYLGNHLIAAKSNQIYGRCVVKNGTKSISNSVFIHCDNLTEVVLPIELKRIGESAFMFCDSLTDIFYYGSIEQRHAIKVEKNNTNLPGATWHYNYDPDNDYYPGDINGDGSVNNKDLTRLFQYLSDWDVEVMPGVLDVNGDKAVNNKDLTRLFQYLSDWDVKIYSDSTNFDYSGDDSGPIISF